MIAPVFAAVWVLLVPGLAWLVWVKFPGYKPDLLETLAETIGLSLALTAVTGQILFFIGLPLPHQGIVGLYFFALLVLLLGAGYRGLYWGIQTYRSRHLPHWGLPAFSLRSAALKAAGALLALLFVGAAIAWRQVQAQELAVPAWVDSVHHTLIVQRILDYGGLPPDLEPYLPVPFYYHYGFHLITAWFAFWSGMSPDQAVLWFGQIINAAVSFSIYRLGKTLFHDGRRAAIAALVVTFVLHMPAYYLTWGRYTMLSGLILLPLAMSAALDACSPDLPRGFRGRWRTWLRLALYTAGLICTHYFILLLFILFLIILGLAELLKAWRARSWKALPWGLVGAVVAGGLLALPWALRVWQYTRSQAAVNVVVPQTGGPVFSWESLEYIMYLLGPTRSHVVMAASLLGFGVLFFTRRTLVFDVWALVLALFSLPWGVQFNPFRPDHFAIVLFLPAALLLADALMWAAELIRKRWLGQGLAALVVVGLVVWGVRETREILNPTTVLVKPAEITALRWIQQNTPPDARFLINSAHWQFNTYRGVDGGYWIMPFSGRWTLVPPVMYTNGDQPYADLIRSWTEQAIQVKGCQADFWELVREADLTHVYLREDVGPLSAAMFADCPRLLPVYQQDGVTILEIQRPR